MNPSSPAPTSSETCVPPDCIKFNTEGTADAILAWGIALLLIAVLLGLRGKRK